MINADVRLLEHDVKRSQARILEHELVYLQEQMNSIATQATLLATLVCYTFNNQDFTGKERGDLTQIVFCLFGGTASLCAFLTIFCAVFVTLWGSTEALRAMNEAHLRKAVVTFREERDFCVRLFVYTIVCSVCSVATVGFLYWSVPQASSSANQSAHTLTFAAVPSSQEHHLLSGDCGGDGHLVMGAFHRLSAH